MPLYRAIYIREERVRGMTFAYDSAEGAAKFAERYVESLKRFWKDAKLLTVIPGKPAKPRQTPEEIARQTPLY